MTYKARLNRAVYAIPRSIQFHTFTGQTIANIKAKASDFIKSNPQPRAAFN